MQNTNSSITKNPKTNVATPHAQKNQKNIPIEYVNWDNISPAGGINSNVVDMCKWISFLLNKGKFNDTAIINQRTFLSLLDAVTPNTVSGFSQKMHPTKHFSAYGMGFNLFDYHGSKVVNHSGGLDGMISHLAYVPEKNFGFVILTNAGTSLPGILMYDLLDAMMNEENKDYAKQYFEIIDKNESQEQEAYKKTWGDAVTTKQPEFDNQIFAGKYSGNVYGSMTIECVKNKLSFKLDHSPTFNANLYYLKDNIFWFEFEKHPSLPRGTITFNINDSKKVTSCFIDLPNPDFDFTELDFKKKSK